MSPHQGAPSRAGTTTDDEFVLLILAVVGLGAITAGAAAYRDWTVHWLVAHGVLVPAAEHPLLALPGAAGAGVDGPRVAVVCGAVVAVFAWAVSAARRALLSRRSVSDAG